MTSLLTFLTRPLPPQWLTKRLFQCQIGANTSRLLWTESAHLRKKTGGTSERQPSSARWPETDPLVSLTWLKPSVGRRTTVPCPTRLVSLPDTLFAPLFSNSKNAGLVEKVPTKEVDTEDGKVQLYAGRRITAAGQKLVDNIAHSVRDETEAQYPGLDKY